MNALSTTRAAVAAALSTATLPASSPQDFNTIECFVPPEYETATSTALEVVVVGVDEAVDIHGTNSTREENDHVYEIRVGTRKRVAAADVTSPDALTELNALSDFREALIDFLKSNRVMGNAQLDSLTNSPAYDPATLDQKKTYVSVITAKYRLLR